MDNMDILKGIMIISGFFAWGCMLIGGLTFCREPSNLKAVALISAFLLLVAVIAGVSTYFI